MKRKTNDYQSHPASLTIIPRGNCKPKSSVYTAIFTALVQKKVVRATATIGATDDSR